MGSEVDYYDVQRMIEDAKSELRGDIDRAVRDACRELRGELGAAAMELEAHIASVSRTLASRTDHLA